MVLTPMRSSTRRPACCRWRSIRNWLGRCAIASVFRSISPPLAARSFCACRASAPVQSIVSSPPAASPRSARRTSSGCIFPRARRCRSSFSAITGPRRISWTAHGWRNGSSRKQRSWGLGFEKTRHARPCAGHPRLPCLEQRRGWPGQSPAMTKVERVSIMHIITLDSETDFDGWRIAARNLVLNDVKPADVTWRVKDNEPELFAPHAETLPLEPARANASFNVPARFVELAQSAILHRDIQRFAILYRLLWRLRGHPDLMSVATDLDVALASTMAKAVRRDE